MHQVRRIPEDPKLFERLLLTRVIAIIAGQAETMQLPPRERVQSLLTNDEIELAIENAAYSAGQFVRHIKEDSPMATEVSGYDQALDKIKVVAREWRELYFGGSDGGP